MDPVVVTDIVTTHYMDEAERCHRLAIISRGVVMATGTPREVVDQRGLRVVEIEKVAPRVAAEALRAHPATDEISHLGAVIRVALRGENDPVALVAELLPEAVAREVRPNVEDVFVSMAREELTKVAS